MKNSNKLIIGSFLLVLAVIVISTLILYGQYQRGNIVPEKDIQDQKLNAYALQSFHHISLSGTPWVNIIPGDTEYIQTPREESNTSVSFRQSGDTLFVTGSNTVPFRRPWADWYYRRSFAPVNLHVRQPKDISLLNGQMLLYGSPRNTVHTTTLIVKNSTVWIGEYNENEKSVQPKEYFDSLDIRMSNSITLLNKPAIIRGLHSILDDNSELNDRQAAITLPDISSSADSRVSMTGVNLKKTIFNSH